jgi:hypothetical protein
MIQESVKAAKAGEAGAWNVLYQQYYPGLYALIETHAGLRKFSDQEMQEIILQCRACPA